MAGNRLATSKPGTTQASRPMACAAACAEWHPRRQRASACALHRNAAAQAAHQVRVHGVGVACEGCKRGHVCGCEAAALLEHGANRQARGSTVRRVRRAQTPGRAERRTHYAHTAHRHAACTAGARRIQRSGCGRRACGSLGPFAERSQRGSPSQHEHPAALLTGSCSPRALAARGALSPWRPPGDTLAHERE
jgi:hypothetical protein